MKWTIENLRKEALKYKTRNSLSTNCPSARTMAQRKGVWNEICAHMEPSKTEAYTFEELKVEALKYSTRGDFQKNSFSIYGAALRKGLIDKICAHMPKRVDQSGENSSSFKWTIDKLKKEALKYKTRKSFKETNQGAYGSARRQGLLEQICGHMTAPYQSNAYTFEELKAEALKYNSRDDFRVGNLGAYLVSHKRKCINEICEHMKPSCGSSKPEKKLLEILKLHFPQAKSFRDKTVKIKDKPHIKGFDIDILVNNKGIEFDGTYWHSVEGLKRSRRHWPKEDLANYSKIKDAWFITKGIYILHIKEKDWLEDKEKCIKNCLKFLRS